MSKIGFIGLGIMGGPMAGHLVKAGHEVTGYDHSEAAIERLKSAGGAGAGSAAEAVRDKDIVITMLPQDEHVESVFADVLEHAATGTLYIDFSTITPKTSEWTAREGIKKGLRVLDAPVSGGEPGAINGTLSIMVGGAEADFDAAEPIFEAVGKTIALVGPNGAGQVVKAANQLVVGGTYALVAEAILLMENLGADAAKGLDVLAGGLAGSKILELKRKTMLERSFQPGFRIDLHHKDMGIILAAARQAEVSIPMGALTAQLIAAARAMGHGSLDHSALLLVAEALSGKGRA
ncbi:NAD(P)-dependent oxidoreductase [Nocardia huaxiensis]|uniref:NAD(P)-dependent oxidoreductase n=1 Tax=Nocardia huaxiensis TaxID=2755382 RepID=A0A7D6VBE4_9NOCA|nr:NAD(P)-dependent oxidoreductase [Nocardia huaxiensis]QLY28897.1 NAD(P)-dependent oxidoreductase [Nocardia huaxiensis]UFS97627.1 NAD(P)-dependent oxidoreductase [Nocardia huaxiensis]